MQGYGAKDDSAIVRQYYPHPIANVSCTVSPEDKSAAVQLVHDLLIGINLVAAAEAVGFARHLQVDFGQFYDLVSNAAGASRVFNEKAKEMTGDGSGSGQSLDEAIAKLETVVQKARDMHVPLHLGNAALNVLFLARRKGVGESASTAVMQAFA